MCLEDTMQKRIDILQGQIDRAKESGEKMNILGTIPMSEQIEIWETLIINARRQIGRS